MASDSVFAKSCEKLSGVNTCFSSNVLCKNCPGDKSRGKTPPEYWDCEKESESAKRWLSEHGVTFEEVK